MESVNQSKSVILLPNLQEVSVLFMRCIQSSFKSLQEGELDFHKNEYNKYAVNLSHINLIFKYHG